MVTPRHNDNPPQAGFQHKLILMHTARRSTARHVCSSILIGATVIIGIGLSGCSATGRSTRTPDRALAVPQQNVIYLVPGRIAVIPVRIDGPIDGTGAYPVRFGKDVPADASLYWIAVSSNDPLKGTAELTAVERSTSIASRASSWMELSIGGNRAFWSATPASKGVRPASTGTWAVVIRTPSFPSEGLSSRDALLTSPRSSDAGKQRPKTIRLGTYETAIQWIDDPSKQEAAWSLPPLISEAALQSPWLRGTLDILAHSPQHRWRVRLATGQPFGLAPNSPISPNASEPPPSHTGAGGTPTDMFLDPILEAMATHVELQWRVALGRLAAESESTALAVAKRLSEVVDFGNGIAMPAWESDAAAVAQLFDLMMSPGIVSGDTADRARLWLESRPTTAVCVTDDAGAADRLTAGAISTFLVANLTDDPTASWAPPPRATVSMEIIAVGPHSAKLVRAISPAAAGVTAGGNSDTEGGAGETLPLSSARASRDGVVIPIRAGAFDLRRRACPWRVPAFPPGCTVGPLRPDWTMRGWLAQAGAPDERADPGPWAARDAADPAWAAAGMIYLGSPSDLPIAMQGSEGGTEQWILYLECLRSSSPQTELATLPPGPMDAGTAQRPGGFLRVWLGPANAPLAVYKVMPDGGIINESPGAGNHAGPPLTSAGTPISARVATEKTRWSCWVPLPKNAIERDGAIRVGLERIDDRGVRSAWPRPMFPWQYEPGRAAIDTKGWTQVKP